MARAPKSITVTLNADTEAIQALINRAIKLAKVEALREAAEDAQVRGDIGKDGELSVPEYLNARALRIEISL